MREFFLKTERLGFSVWSENDILDAFELWGNSEVTKYIASKGRMSKEKTHQRLKKEIDTFNNHNVQYWPIYCIDTDKNIGCCGLRPYDSENHIFELGIHLKDKYWGKGLAKEACLAVIEHAFITLKVNAIFAGHNPNNLESANLLKKLGFIYTHDEYYEPTGLYHPSYLIKKEDYKTKYNNKFPSSLA